MMSLNPTQTTVCTLCFNNKLYYYYAFELYQVSNSV